MANPSSKDTYAESFCCAAIKWRTAPPSSVAYLEMPRIPYSKPATVYSKLHRVAETISPIVDTPKPCVFLDRGHLANRSRVNVAAFDTLRRGFVSFHLRSRILDMHTLGQDPTELLVP